jgi:hypothetical protein
MERSASVDDFRCNSDAESVVEGTGRHIALVTEDIVVTASIDADAALNETTPVLPTAAENLQQVRLLSSVCSAQQFFLLITNAQEQLEAVTRHNIKGGPSACCDAACDMVLARTTTQCNQKIAPVTICKASNYPVAAHIGGARCRLLRSMRRRPRAARRSRPARAASSMLRGCQMALDGR